MTIRDRIKSLQRVRAGDLRPNPRNWREHPPAQRAALEGVLAEVGYADALLARELPDGDLELIDGHLRAGLDPEETVPVLVLDVDEAEAAILLATFDPLAAMAEANEEALAGLLAEIETGSEGLQAMLDGLADEHGIDSDSKPVLTPLDTKPPPAMTWALVGIPTVRFGEIAGAIGAMADIEGIVLETTANDG